ncbi:MAG: hypothetical protein LUQ26_14785 [Methylococcaceae bacterium]|nr:hypothetical protein [Methylococcaceae bacterium]
MKIPEWRRIFVHFQGVKMGALRPSYGKNDRENECVYFKISLALSIDMIDFDAK